MEQNAHNMEFEYQIHISNGEKLLERLKEKYFACVRGVQKLERKIKKDILFLSETLKRNHWKKEHLVCTNLHFYKALIEESINQPNCEAVLETFSYPVDGSLQRLTVDIVSCSGQRWTKVIARNPLALHQSFKDGDSFGRRSIKDQALSYVLAAAQNPHMYCPPQVVFNFINGVPEAIKIFLENLHIVVEGEVIFPLTNIMNSSTHSSIETDDEEVINSDIEVVPEFKKNITRLNLCITTMIAYVSSLTNGGANHKFIEPLLNQQAEWERIRPVKPFLTNLMNGKELICCSSAMSDFEKIVALLGGEEEKRRASSLRSCVTVVPDSSFTGLKPSGKIKKRSIVIFGTGYAHNAVTVTGNKGFVEAAKQKGVRFPVILHESRALTERKCVPESSQERIDERRIGDNKS